MKKLIAEIARMDIGHLREHQANPHVGLSLREEKYLQALEIALPVLEQQEKGDDGWIEWGGGECPVNGGDIVNVKWEDGSVTHCAEACYLCWDHTGNGDIIAYRVIENDGREG